MMVYEKVTLPVARKIAGITQIDLANALSVSENTVINWEKGRSEPTVIQAIQIAEAVNRPLDSIIFFTKGCGLTAKREGQKNEHHPCDERRNNP